MQIGKIDFPSVVLEAQRSGNLVIFAGAGVSVDPPSSYPDFAALADKVGGDVYPRRENEILEDYFGRLYDLGIRVHEQVSSILHSPESRPNANHNALVGLFRNPKQFRIVTTNFDNHFQGATAEMRPNESVEVFFAPALPIGSDFAGIVHVHGSVLKPAERMVLTNTDFGRAYITEGWAARFLERLFSKYLVLFVGYSHEDRVLQYLARGFTAGSTGPGRYALTPPGNDEHWTSLGITPIQYPLLHPPEAEHSQLTVALVRWAEQSQAGALAIEERIRSIVSVGVPLDAESLDFVAYSLTDLSTLRFFVRYALKVEWLSWIEKQDVFRGLFGLKPSYSEKESELAYWFARHFVCKHSNDAMDILRRNSLTISPLMSKVIAHALMIEKPEAPILSKWIALLLMSDWHGDVSETLEHLISNRKYPEDVLPALLIFEYLSKPRLRLTQSLKWPDAASDPEPVTRADVACVGSEFWLNHIWSGFLQPQLDTLAARLIPLVTFHLTAAHRLLESFDRATTLWDPISSSRGMIESRAQDHLYSGMSVMIDVGAEVIRWMCSTQPILADGLISQWFTSESLVLRRLAIFGMTLTEHMAPDSKLQELVTRKLVYQLGTKHEVFMLIRSAYPKASNKARRNLLLTIMAGSDKDLPRDVKDYEKFNLLVWLADSDPQCELAARGLAKLQIEHPEFGRRDHPDMDSWIGPGGAFSWVGPTSADDLLKYDLDKLVQALESTPQADNPVLPSREGLLRDITAAAQGSHEWGISIAREAESRSVWSPGIWNSLIGAWASTNLTPEEWQWIVDLLNCAPTLYPDALDELAVLLERGTQNSVSPLPLSELKKANNIADQLLTLSISGQLNVQEVRVANWLTTSINHPAGRLMEFYLHSLSRLRQLGPIEPDVLNEYKDSFQKGIDAISIGGLASRVLLASQLSFFYSLDEKWATEQIMPLLDPAVNESRAIECWHGYLQWGRWNDAMLTHLLPLYERMFRLVTAESEDIQRAFNMHLASIAVFSVVNPLENGWLNRFLAAAALGARVGWAHEIGMLLDGLDDAAKSVLWHRWLRGYWRQRLRGVPMPLVPAETAVMLHWILKLGPVFPGAVELACQSPYPELRRGSVFYSISKSSLLNDYPDAMAELGSFLASQADNRPQHELYGLDEVVERLISIIPQSQLLDQLCDSLARLGFARAADMHKKLVEIRGA